MQRRPILWMSRPFLTSLLLEVKAITSLIPIYFQLDKIIGQYHL